MARPHPQNVEGPFYVEDGCCIACGVPEAAAPGLFDWDSGKHCYVCRQPASASEVDAMVEALVSSEADCIRYRGDDPAVLRRLAENGHSDLCDQPPPPDAAPVERNHVSFRMAKKVRLSSVTLAADFRRFLRGQPRPVAWRVRGGWPASTVRFAWYEDNFHTVKFSAAPGRPGIWLGRHESAFRPGGQAVSRLVHEWLTASPEAVDIRWYTSAQWHSGQEGSSRPY